MKQFLLIWKHYFFRTILNVNGFLEYIIFPLGLIFVFGIINEVSGQFDEGIMIQGYHVINSTLSVNFLVFFQFFSGAFLLGYLHDDFKSSRRWRLYAAPCSPSTYLVSAMAASWVASIVQGLIIILVTSILLNVYWGNLFVLLVVLFVTALLSQVLYMLLFVLTKKKGEANTIGNVIIWVMAILGGLFGELGMVMEGIAIIDCFNKYNSFALAKRAISYSGTLVSSREFGFMSDISVSIWNITFLITIIVLLVFSIYVIEKRLKNDDF